jgi:regulator of sigma E protease
MSRDERKRSFHLKPVWQRAAIVAAGPAANFLLAILIFAGIFYINGRPLIEARISEVEAGSPAAVAGLRSGDLIQTIDGSEIETFGEVQRIVSGAAETPLAITVQRDGEALTLTAIPERREITDSFGNTFSSGILGVRRTETADVLPREYYSPVGAVGAGAAETWFVVTRTMNGLADIITGRESASQISGPIRIAKVSGDFYSVSIGALISLAALLSVSIGLINLFPIPMLDGGHLVFYAIEALKGRPLSERAQEIGFQIGLTLVLMLMIFATFNDVRQILS